jgi:hypothetical protein
MATNKFSDEPTNASRALQIYLILIGAAHRRETMTYKALAALMYGTKSLSQKFIKDYRAFAT